jgi:hypothetical protein
MAVTEGVIIGFRDNTHAGAFTYTCKGGLSNAYLCMTNVKVLTTTVIITTVIIIIPTRVD